jgi:hypothetical protein
MPTTTEQMRLIKSAINGATSAGFRVETATRSVRIELYIDDPGKWPGVARDSPMHWFDDVESLVSFIDGVVWCRQILRIGDISP